MSILHLLILSLACYRLSELFSSDIGPYEIFVKFRHWAGVRYDDHSEPYGTNEFSRGLLCVWCNSIWFGIVITVLYVILGNILVYILLPLALSGAVILAKEFQSRG